MSAIWGAISMNNQTLSKEISTVFLNAYDKCAIDRVEEVWSSQSSIYMGCGVQYFTKEAENEHLPYKSNNKYFTADVVLDNRDELLKKLDFLNPATINIPDGEILYHMFEQYDDSCLEDLLGAYAFVNYDVINNRVDAVIDAVGNRMIYYSLYNNVFYFSSLLSPLAELTAAKLNDRWITDFLAMDHLFMFNEAVETPYANIYRIAPAHHLICKDNVITVQKYWDPTNNVSEFRFKDDSAYKKAFRDVFFKAVQCTMRGDESRPLSAMLSGGYDSTSVVSVASKYLDKGQLIHSYTSIPLASYKIKEDGYYVEDESELVSKSASYLGNVKPHFIEMQGVDAWNAHPEALKSIEMPYKSPQNMLWMPECMKSARDEGSRIMLTGSYGNTTISFTDMDWYMNELIRHHRFIRIERELHRFQKIFKYDINFARKEIYKAPIVARKNLRNNVSDRVALFGHSYAKDEMLNKMDARNRMLDLNKKYTRSLFDRKVQRGLIVQDIALRQIGEMEQKFSLATGVLLRDPTRDKRVIEFCIRLPLSQFAKNGQERRLVSQYLADIIPPWILTKKIKGRQSADFSYRLSLRWNEIRDEWMENYNHSDSVYIDTQAAYNDLKEKSSIDEYKQMDLTRHFYTQLVIEFEKNNKFDRMRDLYIIMS